MKYRIALTLFSAMLGLSIPGVRFRRLTVRLLPAQKIRPLRIYMISEAEAGMLEEGQGHNF